MVSISSVFCTLASPKVLAFDKTNLNKFYLLLFSLIRTFMSFRVMKLGCIWEKYKNILLFPLICTNFDLRSKILTFGKTQINLVFRSLNRIFATMIRNIVLDWGGILIDLDGQSSIDEFNRIGALEVAKYVEFCRVEDMFLRLELGQIDTTQFCLEAREQDPAYEGSDEALCHAWNVLLSGIPDNRLRRLEELKDRCRLFLLSNTNEIHWEYARRWWQPEDYFEKIFLSYEMHQVKPDKEIFLQMLQEGGMKAEETLFIDDSKRNCEAAAALGIQTIHAKSLDYVDNLPW